MITTFNTSPNYGTVGFAIRPSVAGVVPSVVDTPSHQESSGGAASDFLSKSYTIGANTDRVLWVIVENFYADVLDGAFSGVPFVIADQGMGSEFVRYCVFYLVNPLATTANVFITFTASFNDAKAMMYFTTQGTDQTHPYAPLGIVTDDGVAASTTTTPIPNVADCLLCCGVMSYKVATPHTHTTDGSQSENWNFALSNVTWSGSTKSADRFTPDPSGNLFAFF